MRLLKKQKLDLFTVVKNTGFFDPAQFVLHGADSGGSECTLNFKGSEYLCQISFPNNTWVIKTIPGIDSWASNYALKNWDESVLRIINEWLGRLRLEIETPDPWLALNNLPLPDQGVISNTSNSPFSYPEWESISRGLENIRTFLLKSTGDTSESHVAINDRIDKLIEDGKKVGRKDWFNLAVGTLASLAISLGTQPEITKKMWELLKMTVSGIVQLAPVITEAAKHLGG